MDAGVMVVGVAVLVLIGFALIGGPMLLADWSRKRRQTLIDRQIALTDALDRQLGPLVTPVVRKRLFGPWEIQLTVPLHRATTVARILVVLHEVFAEMAGGNGDAYRIVLSPGQDAPRAIDRRRAGLPATRWAGDRGAA